IHKRSELAAYFNAQVKKPKKALTYDPPIDDNDIPVKIWFGRQGWRALTKGPRFERATWLGVRPDDPVADLKELRSIQSTAGLDHIDKANVLASLIDQCREWMRRHPRLRYWIESRIALLEFATGKRPTIPEKLADSASRLREVIQRASFVMW